MKVGIVVPHIFMHRDILPHVIFSPAKLAFALADGLKGQGIDVTLFSPGPVDTTAKNITADLSLFERELEGRGDNYIDLLKKHPVTFVSLARQVQGELIAKAYAMANRGELDIVHIYTNEEDIALPFAQLCNRPVVFSHHDPFNFLVKYKDVFPKYAHLNWLSVSLSQRRGMPENTKWAGNVYHGIDTSTFIPSYNPSGQYLAYLGRIIEPKGVHLAINALRQYNKTARKPLKLKIAGKHYSGSKDTYWQDQILPQLNDADVEYVGFISTDAEKQQFLGQAAALLVPSTFDEPFGLVTIEAMACGTPAIGLDSGALPEVIKDGTTGFIVKKSYAYENDKQALDEQAVSNTIAQKISQIPNINRLSCRRHFEENFTTKHMVGGHIKVYKQLVKE